MVFDGDAVGCFNGFIAVSTILSCFSVSRFVFFVCVVAPAVFHDRYNSAGKKLLMLL